MCCIRTLVSHRQARRTPGTMIYLAEEPSLTQPHVPPNTEGKHSALVSGFVAWSELNLGYQEPQQQPSGIQEPSAAYPMRLIAGTPPHPYESQVTQYIGEA